jgi:hypothetical protein
VKIDENTRGYEIDENTLGIMGAGGKASNVKVLTGASLHLSHLGVHI